MAHAGEEFAFQFCGVLHLAVAQFKLFVRGRERGNEFPLLLFIELSLGNVRCHNDLGRPTEEIQSVGSDLHIDEASVFSPVPPEANLLTSIRETADHFQHSGNVLGRPDVFDGHGEEFIAGISVLTYRGGVYREKSQGFAVIDPGGMWIIIEQLPVPLFALMQQPFRMLALGNVAGDLGKAAQFAGGVSQSSDDDVGPKSRPVFSYPPTFFFVAACGEGGLEFVFWLAFFHLFWRVKTGEVPAYDFIGLVAFDAFCPLVPTGYASSGIEHENGVVPYVVYEQTKALLTFAQRIVYASAFRDVPCNRIDNLLLGHRNGIPRKPFV